MRSGAYEEFPRLKIGPGAKIKDIVGLVCVLKEAVYLMRRKDLNCWFEPKIRYHYRRAFFLLPRCVSKVGESLWGLHSGRHERCAHNSRVTAL